MISSSISFLSVTLLLLTVIDACFIAFPASSPLLAHLRVEQGFKNCKICSSVSCVAVPLVGLAKF
jgi:hypothetical protein